MTKKREGQNTQHQRPKANGDSGWLRFFQNFFDAFARMVDRVGWAGALIVLIFCFVQYNGTAEQKQKIIDKFVLGSSGELVYPFIGLVLIGVVVFLGQNYYWRKRVQLLNEEVDRLSKWKTDHQQRSIPGGLHHTGKK